MACWLLLSGEVNKNLLGSPGCDFFLSLSPSCMVILFKAGKIKYSLFACVFLHGSIYMGLHVCVCVSMLICAFFKGQVPLLLLEYISHLHIAILECQLLEAISSQPLSDG